MDGPCYLNSAGHYYDYSYGQSEMIFMCTRCRPLDENFGSMKVFRNLLIAALVLLPLGCIVFCGFMSCIANSMVIRGMRKSLQEQRLGAPGPVKPKQLTGCCSRLRSRLWYPCYRRQWVIKTLELERIEAKREQQEQKRKMEDAVAAYVGAKQMAVVQRGAMDPAQRSSSSDSAHSDASP